MASSSAISTIERILEGKTTLKTQRLAHSNIICIGTELLEQIQKIMREDQEKAVAEAVKLCEKKAAAKLRNEIEFVTEIMRKEKEMELQSLVADYTNQMLEQMKKQAAEEEQRALDAKLQYEKEKQNAVKQAIETERKERDEYVESQIRIVIKKLKEQAKMDLENELLLQEEILQQKFRKAKEEAISSTRKQCEREKELLLKGAAEKYGKEIDRVNASLEYTAQMLEIEKGRKDDIQKQFLELKEDYKRFQDYTDKFHSDYLLP